MSSAALLRRRAAIRLAALRWETLALGLAGLLGLFALGLTLAASRGDRAQADPAAPLPLAPTPASARLIAATSGDQSQEVRATGLAAEQINAALPFSDAPVQAAAPFQVPSGGTAYERALTCLTQAVYFEAGYEPLPGRRAVAQVILNRMRHPAFPKSVCGVVYQHNATPICQFTFVCDGSLQRRPSSAGWAEAQRVAEAALSGHVERSVGKATHYHADYVAPRWAPMLTKVHKIGAHIFYRWPGAWGLRSAFTGRYLGEPSDPLALRPSGASHPLLAEADEGEPASLAAASAELTFEQDKTVRRAANDVGGLLDPSKGWRLSIPDPQDSMARTRALLAEQGGPPREPAALAAVTTAASGGAALAPN
jgi:spore germination cell wall hydrolase CwlJ-like protein